MRQLHTAVITTDSEVAKLWASEQDQITTVLPIPQCETQDQPMEEFELDLALYENCRVVQHPNAVKESRPDVVVVHTPGLMTSGLTKMLRQDNLRVIGGGVLNDTFSFQTDAVRNVLDDMRPDQVRRFIRTKGRGWRFVLTDLMWTKLRHGQDQYWLDFPSGCNLGVFEGKSRRAAEILNDEPGDHTAIGGMLQRYDDMMVAPLCIDIVAMFSRCKGQVSQSSDILHTGRFINPRLAFFQVGTKRMAMLLPRTPALDDVMAKLALMLSSLDYSGPLRMRYSWDTSYGWRLFDLHSVCEFWHLDWWRNAIRQDQSWHSLWHSVAKGANFDFLMTDLLSPGDVTHYLKDLPPRPQHYSQEQWDMLQHFLSCAFSEVQGSEPNLEEKEGKQDEQFARS